MPYKNRTLRIPSALDRRRRVTEDMAENMIAMYRDGESLHSIAREFNVDRKTVKRFVIPGYAEAAAAKRKIDKPWLRNYDKDKWREYMRSHRHYKRELELADKLIP